MRFTFTSTDPSRSFGIDMPYQDILNLKDSSNLIIRLEDYISNFTKALPEIKRVVFNERATIILWADGDKTVVKLGHGEVNDPEKGMAMAICKKVLGNTGSYYEIFKKWLPADTEVTE